MPRSYFEDLPVGYQSEVGRARVPTDEAIAFARQWEPAPYHVDPAAARESIYGGLTLCSLHLFAIVTRLFFDHEDRIAVLGMLGKDGVRLWTYAVGRVVMDLERLPDVNGDGCDDVVVGSWSSDLICLSGKDGALIWAKTVAADVWSVDVLEDVNGDGKWEAVGGSLGSGSGVARCYSNAGNELWTHNFSERIYDVENVGDVTGDGVSELCVCLQDKNHEAAHVWLYDLVGDIGVRELQPRPAPAPKVGYAFALGAARPNPSRGEARIAFTLAEAGATTLELYDLSGRKVRTLWRDDAAEGPHDVAVDLCDVAPGVYIYRLTAPNDAAARRLVVAK